MEKTLQKNQAFQQLQEDEKRLLYGLVFLESEGLLLSQFHGLLGGFISFSTANNVKLKKLLNHLVERGWIQEIEKGGLSAFRVYEDQRLTVYKHFFEAGGKYLKILERIREKYPVTASYSWSTVELTAFVREMRISIIKNEWKIFKNHLDTYFYLSEMRKEDRLAFQQKLFASFDNEHLKTLDERFILSNLEILRERLFDAEKITQIKKKALDFIRTMSLGSRLKKINNLILGCFSGDLEFAEKQTKKFGGNFRELNALGLLAFHKGQWKLALDYFYESLEDYRKVVKKEKAVNGDFHCFYFLLCHMVNDSEENYMELIRLTRMVQRQNNSLLLNLIEVLVKNRLGSLDVNIEQIFQSNKYKGDNAFEQFFTIFIQYWMNIDEIYYVNDALYLLRKLEENGYKWMAMQLHALLSELNQVEHKTHHKNEYEKYRVEIGYQEQALYKMVHFKERWELTLSALEKLSIEPIKNATTNTTELFWALNLDDLYIVPKIRTRTKNGKWGKYKSIALKRLLSGNLEYMNSQDMRIAACIDTYQGHYGKVEYLLNQERALRALVGHSRILTMSEPHNSIELLSANPELIVREELDTFFLQCSVHTRTTGLFLESETPTRYQLIDVLSQDLEIMNILGKEGLTVPKTQKQRLLSIVNQIKKRMPIRSELTELDQNIPVLESNNNLYIHIFPIGDAFNVECFVKPHHLHGKYYKPGEGGKILLTTVQGQEVQISRCLETELARVQEFIAHCHSLSTEGQERYFWELKSPADCLQLLKELNKIREKNYFIIEWPKGETLKLKASIGFKSLSMQINKKQDWFSVQGEVKIDENKTLSMQELLRLVNNSQGEFIEISKGNFLQLEESFREKLKALSNLSEEKDGELQIHSLASVALEEFSEAVEDLVIDEHWQNHVEQLNFIKNKNYVVPKDLNAELRSYQLDGYKWLSQLADWGVGACLADDMGLGKTLQALTIILERADNGPSLVVAPASVCSNWINELKKFTPTLNPIFLADEKRELAIKRAGARDVIITTYGLLQQEVEHLVNRTFETVVLDEAQAIKNSQAKRSKAAMKLNANYKIITTGTPIENHLGELWNLFRFINPGLLGSLENFKERFILPIEKYGIEECRFLLQQLIRPFILRRKKDEVLKELPSKTEVTLRVSLSKEEREFYEALRKNAIEEIEESKDSENSGTQHLRILAQLMRLRRACCHPQLILPETTLEGAKIKLFKETIRELLENDHKVLVFSQFVGHLNLLKEGLESMGVAYQYLDGSTPIKKRQQRIDAFQSGEGDVFLISLKAGGTGLNLTEADYVIHMDPWWNPAVEDQASDRAHRIGQKRPVTVYRMIAENTIEEKILELHEQKRDLANSLLSGTNQSAKLTGEELLALIKNI